MNRSTRQSTSSSSSFKQAKVDASTSKNFTEIQPQPPLNPLRPKPPPPPPTTTTSTSLNDPTVVEYFPELAFDSLNNAGSSVDGIVLPEPIPPLPPNLHKVYNTRKRNFNSTYPSTSPSTSHSTSHSTQNDASNSSKPAAIPGFVSKLYRMVDESTSNLIKWGTDGKTFVVTSPEDFSRQVLPLFFKHNNFSSFVRQLNMYGFHKVPHLQQGSMVASSIGNNESTIWEFSHVNFIKNRPDSLINVRRKIVKDEDLTSTPFSPNPSVTSLTESLGGLSSDDLVSTARSLRQELAFIYQQQNALRTDLQSLQRDNQLLWTENLASRERHLQQQQVIDRILRFLASVFTTDGKLLSSATNGSINANTLSALQSNLFNTGEPTSSTASARHKTRPLLLGNISGNEDELRRHVLELISGAAGGGGGGNSDKIDLIPDNNIIGPVDTDLSEDQASNSAFIDRLEDLETTTRDISQDISSVNDGISKLNKLGSRDSLNAPIYDDLDFSNYLDCQ